MRLLPIVSPSDVPRFVRHCGTAVFLRHRPLESAGPSIAVANELIDALPGPGIRVVIAPLFGARFFSEAIRQGILPVALSEESVEAIGAGVEANPRLTIAVDLETQTVDVPGLGTFSFETPPRARRKLLQGLEDLDELMEHRDAAARFRMEDRNRRPWLYE